MGNRVVKENAIAGKKEIYIRDAQGNVLVIYEIKKNGNVDSLYSKEFHIFGTNRVGYLMDNMFLSRKIKGKVVGGNVGMPVIPVSPKNGNVINIFQLPGSTTLTPIYFGNK